MPFDAWMIKFNKVEVTLDYNELVLLMKLHYNELFCERYFPPKICVVVNQRNLNSNAFCK